MAGVEYSSQSYTSLKGLNHDAMHFVVSDVALVSEVDWVDDLVIPIWFVAVEILGLSAVTYDCQLCVVLWEDCYAPE